VVELPSIKTALVENMKLPDVNKSISEKGALKVVFLAGETALLDTGRLIVDGGSVCSGFAEKNVRD
jgi:hypothetical protein